jgi:D-tyrosyl-tRNA(Tyr) deacylase
MRAVVQRVERASVEVAGERLAEVGHGLLVLVAAGAGDGAKDARWLARKVARLRVFADERERVNRSLADVGGAVLAVSQFTLYGDVSRGNRPSFVAAAPPEEGERLVEAFVAALREEGVPVETGRFGAHMRVSLVNDGPVTLVIDSP